MNLLLIIGYILIVALHIFNLLFIVHNIYRYVIGLNMKRYLIVTFYALTLISTLTRIAEFSFQTASISKFVSNKSATIFYTNALALLLGICIELVLILTIQRLTLALRFIIEDIHLARLRQAERSGLVITITLAVVYLTFFIQYFVTHPFGSTKPNRPWFLWCLLGLLVALSILYTVVII